MGENLDQPLNQWFYFILCHITSDSIHMSLKDDGVAKGNLSDGRTLQVVAGKFHST